MNIDTRIINILRSFFVSGRNRTDRAVPTASTQVNAGIDREGDKISKDGFTYIVENVSGTLTWVKYTGDTSWP